ncbi:MAG: hypothetical protein J2P16_13390, partial [Mycobacterium sp.]|nr:hypothetical protein [Mycobacterium sp.]
IRRDREIARAAIIATAIPAATLAAYLIGNKAYAGTAFPVSGAAKTTFPRPTLGNWRDFSNLLQGNHLFAPVRLYRHGPVLLCAFIAIVFLATIGRAAWARARFAADDPAVRYRLALAATAVGVVLLSAYDWFFVPAYAQGHWYWPVSTLFVSLACFEWLGLAARSWERRTARAALHRLPTAAPFMTPAARRAVAVGILGALCLAGFLVLGHRDGYHERFAAFALHASPGARSFLRTADPHGAQLLAVDDGIDAWELDLPALSGTGLMLDHAAEQARTQGRLVDVAVARGDDHVSSVAYVDTRRLGTHPSSREIAARLQSWLPGQNLGGFEFTVEYRSRPLPNPVGGASPFVLIRVSHGY